MTTANQLIASALQIVTSLSPGEGIPGEEADFALGVLNTMLKAWSAEKLMQPCRTLENFSIAQGIGSRTIGSGAQINTTRPDYVTGAFLRDSGGQDYPINVNMTKEEYNSILNKSNTGRPSRIFFDPQFPNAILYFDVVTAAAYTLYLETLKPFNQFTTLQTEMQLPGEYEEGIIYLLVKRLSVPYGFEIQPGSNLADLIAQAEARIERKNFSMPPAQIDPALCRPPQFDINAG
jgi:hypothetical protein